MDTAEISNESVLVDALTLRLKVAKIENMQLRERLAKLEKEIADAKPKSKGAKKK